MMKLFRFKKIGRRSQRRGATAVEFAMVVPIFALFCVVCLDFARLSLARHVVQNSVYRAGRMAMTEGVTRQDTIDAVNDYLSIYGLEPAEGSTVAGQVYLDDSGRVLPVNTTSEFDSESVEFHVEVSVPFANATLVFDSFFPSWVKDREIRSVIRVRSERYNGFFNPADAYAN
jgi:Flp pilus assembly protein TadG